MAAAFPGDSLRFDPNARLVHRAGHSFRPGASKACVTITWKIRCTGSNGMRRDARDGARSLATNTVVVNFEQLAANASRHRRRCDPS